MEGKKEKRYFGVADIKADYDAAKTLRLMCFFILEKGRPKDRRLYQIIIMSRHVFGARDSPCIAIKALEKMIENFKISIEESQRLMVHFIRAQRFVFDYGG